MKRRFGTITRTWWFPRLPAFLLGLMSWIVLGVIFLRVDPRVIAALPLTGSYIIIAVLLFLALWSSLYSVGLQALKSLVRASAVTAFAWLRLIDLGNYLNLLLIGFLWLTIEQFWRGQAEPVERSQELFDE